jgi:ferredoxin-thioredoxin reductase catalytic subunit
LNIDDSDFSHNVVIAVHKSADARGLSKCPCDAVVGNLGEEREFSNGWRWRRITRIVDYDREIISLVLTNA